MGVGRLFSQAKYTGAIKGEESRLLLHRFVSAPVVSLLGEKKKESAEVSEGRVKRIEKKVQEGKVEGSRAVGQHPESPSGGSELVFTERVRA